MGDETLSKSLLFPFGCLDVASTQFILLSISNWRKALNVRANS